MARTNKKGARVMKQQQSKLAKVRTSNISTYTKVSSLEQGIELGLLTSEINPLGNTYHWFVYGRKVCWETGIKIDKDMCRYIRRHNIYVKIQPSGWQIKKIKRK